MKGFILSKEKNLNDYGNLRLLEAGKKAQIEIKVVTPGEFDILVSRRDRNSVLLNGIRENLPHFIIPRMGSETTYFGLAVIRQLERLGVYSCNSPSTIETVRDKLHVHQILAESNLPTPRTMMAKFPISVDLIEQEIGFPIVIKNIIGTRGIGIYLCKSKERFLDLMDLIHSYNRQANMILQQYIDVSHGRDLRVFVIGGKVVGCMKRISKSGFKANYSIGGEVEPHPVTEEIEWLALETARLLKLEVTGVDLLFDEGGFKICEANSAPDFMGMEKVIGKHIAEDIIAYVLDKTKEKG